MVVEIPLDLFELVKKVVQNNIEEYDIEMENNEQGQGFVGEIFFLTVTHRKLGEKYQLLVKQEKKASGQSKDFFVIFVQNEMNFYGSIWPFLQEYYKKASGKDLNIIPKCFGTLNADRKQIIMENIRPQGYVVYDKTKPFDDDHFTAIFKTYGIFHAISMALREHDREQYSRLVGMQKNTNKKIYGSDSLFCVTITERFRDAQEFFDPVQEKHLLEKLRMYEESGVEMLRQVVDEDISKGAIIHGDCWSSNLMFQYNEEKIIQNIKLLDFQAACHGCPVFDLSYCLYSGASEETLNKLDEYLKIYHDSLSATLSEFDLIAENIYSFNTFKKEWKKYCKISLPLGLVVWKIKLVDKENIPDFSQDVNPPIILSDSRKEMYKKRVRELAYHFYNQDFF